MQSSIFFSCTCIGFLRAISHQKQCLLCKICYLWYVLQDWICQSNISLKAKLEIWDKMKSLFQAKFIVLNDTNRDYFQFYYYFFYICSLFKMFWYHIYFLNAKQDIKPVFVHYDLFLSCTNCHRFLSCSWRNKKKWFQYNNEINILMVRRKWFFNKLFSHCKNFVFIQWKIVIYLHVLM